MGVTALGRGSNQGQVPRGMLSALTWSTREGSEAASLDRGVLGSEVSSLGAGEGTWLWRLCGPLSQLGATECPSGREGSLFLEFWMFGCTESAFRSKSPAELRGSCQDGSSVGLYPSGLACFFPVTGQIRGTHRCLARLPVSARLVQAVSLISLDVLGDQRVETGAGWVSLASPVPGSFQSLTSTSSRTSR